MVPALLNHFPQCKINFRFYAYYFKKLWSLLKSIPLLLAENLSCLRWDGWFINSSLQFPNSVSVCRLRHFGFRFHVYVSVFVACRCFLLHRLRHSKWRKPYTGSHYLEKGSTQHSQPCEFCPSPQRIIIPRRNAYAAVCTYATWQWATHPNYSSCCGKSCKQF